MRSGVWGGSPSAAGGGGAAQSALVGVHGAKPPGKNWAFCNVFWDFYYAHSEINEVSEDEKSTLFATFFGEIALEINVICLLTFTSGASLGGEKI